MKISLLSSTSGKPAPYLYFVNASVDYFFVGGITIFAFLILSITYTIGHVDKTWIYSVAALLVWVCNWPHFAATNYRLYHTKENILQYPVTAMVTPPLLIVVVILAFALPTVIAPPLIAFYLLWSSYHFCGQSVGITLIYARRAGYQVGRLERLALSGFIFGTYFLAAIRANVGINERPYYGVMYSSLNLPQFAVYIAIVWLVICGLASLGFIIRWSLINNRRLPTIVFLPAITQFVWFVHGWSGNAHPGFYELVPFFHSLQYLLIAWMVQLKERMETKQIAPSSSYVWKESFRWGAIIFVGGALLFWLLPRSATVVGFDLQIATAILITVVQIHHFFVDGVIWKLKNPKVSSPLLVNIEQLIHQSPTLTSQTVQNSQTIQQTA
jgi:hypothetical protein